ncbi:MAG: type II toxin-antitoxin system RelE/ParE family toxin [Oscillospiraceae bacterium]|nr:type II toxin-antitoxin system RelE/ParE family toxin [Oscillospiraceae bacterium]
MNVHHYETAGGKDVIEAYIDKLSKNEIIDGYSVLKAFAEDRIDEVKVKKWRGKIWEAYFYKDNRLFYVIIDGKDVYFLHACRKQKNKTEKKDGDIVLKRASELSHKLSKTFI